MEAEIAAKKAERAAKDAEVCKSSGAKPLTDIYVQCRTAQVKGRDDADNAAMMHQPAIVNNVNTTNDPPLYPKLAPITYGGPRCTSRGC